MIRSAPYAPRPRRMSPETIQKLQAALDELKDTSEITTVCSFCDRVRDREGNWVVLPGGRESFSADNLVSHGCCPGCAKEHFPEEYAAVLRKNAHIIPS